MLEERSKTMCSNESKTSEAKNANRNKYKL